MEETIDKEDLTDNSEDFYEQEPADDVDNSDNSESQKEPENNQQDGSKFKTIEDATKSYAELEKKLGEQSNELGELRKKAELADKLQKQFQEQELKKANERGFDTIEQYQNNQELINYEANLYLKHLQECEYPDEMKRLLAEYVKNPSDEIRNTIETEFSIDTLKQVAGEVAIFKGQLQQKVNEALEQEVYNSAKEYLDTYVNKYSDEFKNPAFAALYGEAFRALGCNLNTDKFITLLKEYGNSVLQAAGIKNSVIKENSLATDEIAGLSNITDSSLGNEKNILEMSEDEIRRELKKYK